MPQVGGEGVTALEAKLLVRVKTLRKRVAFLDVLAGGPDWVRLKTNRLIIAADRDIAEAQAAREKEGS